MQTIKVAVLRGDMLGLYLKTFQKMKPSINGYFLVDQMMIYRSNDRKTWFSLTIYNIYKYRETCHHTALSSPFDVLYKWLPLVLDNY